MSEPEIYNPWPAGCRFRCMEKPPARDRVWRLVVLGPPGIGKGTQACFLEDRLGACHLSTGNMFHAVLQPDVRLTPELEGARERSQRGRLGADRTVLRLIEGRRPCFECGLGFLLDGFPRTMEQARALDAMLAELGKKLDAVLSYDLDDEVLVKRMKGRRYCPKCSRTYHMRYNRPRVGEVCDACGTMLVQREDDRPDSMMRRIKNFHKNTWPVLDHYDAKGKLIKIDAMGTPAQVAERTMHALKQL